MGGFPWKALGVCLVRGSWAIAESQIDYDYDYDYDYDKSMPRSSAG
jgi:hypothetical protein